MTLSPKSRLALTAVGLSLAAAGGHSVINRRKTPTVTLDEVNQLVLDKTQPHVAELFDYINTLNIIVLMEERSDKKIKRVNSIIRNYCNVKAKEAKHDGTRVMLKMISSKVLCREELRKAVTALNIIENNAQEVIGFKE
mgnify:CR=1 FL=1